MITKDISIYKRLNDLISANKNIKVLFVAPRRSGKTLDSFKLLKEYANRFIGNYLFIVHNAMHKKYILTILELNNESKVYVLTIREALKFQDTVKGVIIDEPDLFDQTLLESFIEKVIPVLNINDNSLFILIGSFYSTSTKYKSFLYNYLKTENNYIKKFYDETYISNDDLKNLEKESSPIDFMKDFKPKEYYDYLLNYEKRTNSEK